ncbi:hypothetical protein GGR43_004364 [Sphingobium jiangsuense]|uniref:Uncharacterized protein n=2 Tax=Sphingobium jiangsuense TaxID=870476 RepID=A0A7W6FT03_9SPHN|nr:hypothetical protein [Sphingobium jiangsuense]
MAGHANGRPDPGLSVTLYTNDGQVIASERADAQGLARFARPAGPFYVLIGDKRGDTSEVDWRDVAPRPTPATRSPRP